MTELAKELESRGYTLRSGGAQGADTAFEKGVSNKKEIFPGGQKAGERELKIAREIHPNPQALDNSKNPAFVWNLMARNTNQVFGKNLDVPVDFVIAWTQDALTDYTKRSIKSGGTGQAIDMASRKGIPVINLANPNWRQELDRVLSAPTQPSTGVNSEIIMDIEKRKNDALDYLVDAEKIVSPGLPFHGWWQGIIDINTPSEYTIQAKTKDELRKLIINKYNEELNKVLSKTAQPSISVKNMTLKEYADRTSVRFIEVRQVLTKDDIKYFNDKVNDLIADRLKYAIFATEDLNNRQYLPFINKLKENGFEPVKGMEYVLSKGGVNPKEEYAKLTTQQPTSVEGAGTISGKTIKLKNGVTYGFSAVNAKMLSDMGYTPKEAGKILKSIC
jgi:hypothetical protein